MSSNNRELAKCTWYDEIEIPLEMALAAHDMYKALEEVAGYNIAPRYTQQRILAALKKARGES